MLQRIVSKIDKHKYTRKLLSAYLRFNKFVWEKLPDRILKLALIEDYGRFLHTIVKVREERVQNTWTYFYRNRPEMDLIHDLAAKSKVGNNTINIMVLACSVGMEAYCIKWRLRDLELSKDINISGIELSSTALAVAKKGSYPVDEYKQYFERISEQEFDKIFRVVENVAHIRAELKQGIRWYQGDAFSVDNLNLYGKQDIVLANRVLCHMYPEQAEKCLNSITNLVSPNGFLFVSGVDLPIRKKVMAMNNFSPVEDLLVEIHYGDSTLLRGWPWRYWGLEPIKMQPKIDLCKYAMVYQNTSFK